MKKPCSVQGNMMTVRNSISKRSCALLVPNNHGISITQRLESPSHIASIFLQFRTIFLLRGFLRSVIPHPPTCLSERRRGDDKLKKEAQKQGILSRPMRVVGWGIAGWLMGAVAVSAGHKSSFMRSEGGDAATTDEIYTEQTSRAEGKGGLGPESTGERGRRTAEAL